MMAPEVIKHLESAWPLGIAMLIKTKEAHAASRFCMTALFVSELKHDAYCDAMCLFDAANTILRPI